MCSTGAFAWRQLRVLASDKHNGAVGAVSATATCHRAHGESARTGAAGLGMRRREMMTRKMVAASPPLEQRPGANGLAEVPRGARPETYAPFSNLAASAAPGADLRL